MAHSLLNPAVRDGCFERFAKARRYPRVLFQTPVEVRAGRLSALGEARNVGLGGLLLHCPQPLQPGDEVKVLFNLPTGHSISTRCILVHAQAEQSIGVRFVQLEDHCRSAMAGFIQKLVAYTRRGARIPKRLHVTLRTADGQEMAETLALSRHGGLLVTRAHFGLSDIVHLSWPEAKRGAEARIVHRRSSGIAGLSELGFEFTNESDFWQLDFPPEIAE